MDSNNQTDRPASPYVGRPTQPVVIIPTQKRLQQPHSVCDLQNIGSASTHVVIDRHMVGHELRPGQTVRGVEMLDKDLDYFRRQARPGRTAFAGGQMKQLNPHPIKVLDARQINSEEDQKKEDERNVRLQKNMDPRPLHERIGETRGSGARPQLRKQKTDQDLSDKDEDKEKDEGKDEGETSTTYTRPRRVRVDDDHQGDDHGGGDDHHGDADKK